MAVFTGTGVGSSAYRSQYAHVDDIKQHHEDDPNTVNILRFAKGEML